MTERHFEDWLTRRPAEHTSANGEAGLRHLREAAATYHVLTAEAAEAVARELCSWALVPTPQIAYAVARPHRKWRGTYSCAGLVTLYVTGLPTLIHELAHHVVVVRRQQTRQSHGPAFKRALAELYRVAFRLLGIKIQAPKRAALPSVGAWIVVRRCGTLGRVVAQRRTRVLFKTAAGQLYQVAAEAVSLVEAAVAAEGPAADGEKRGA